MPRKVSSKRRTTRKNKRVAGGAGASQFAEYVFGGPDVQKAVGAGSNVIATNDPTGYTPYAVGGKMPEVKGGSRKSKRGGKGMLTDIAVPALLLYANNAVKRTNKEVYGTVKKFTRSFNKSKKN
jgi:hypothetical protein